MCNDVTNTLECILSSNPPTIREVMSLRIFFYKGELYDKNCYIG